MSRQPTGITKQQSKDIQEHNNYEYKERGNEIMAGKNTGSSGFSSGFKPKKIKAMPAAAAICCLNCGMPLPPSNPFFCDRTCTSSWRTGRKKSEWGLNDRY